MDSDVTYEVEGGVDFFKELKNIRAKKPTDTSMPSLSLTIEDKPIERCLITDEVLRKDYITLKCGHKFNYVPLFKEVLFQKCSMLPKNVSSKIVTMYIKNNPVTTLGNTANTTTPLPTFSSANATNVTTVMYNSSYNLETTKIQYNEMKCPYCRCITPHILPYYAYPDVSKIKYVNTPAELALPVLSCEYHQYVSLDTHNSNETICKMSCTYNEKYDRMLCNKHFNKLEMDAANVSVSTKNKKSCVKPSTCNSSRRDRRTTKTGESVCDENVIISHHNPSTAVCCFTLLSGPRKGTPCGKPMWVPKTGHSSAGASASASASVAAAASSVYCKVHYEKANCGK